MSNATSQIRERHYAGANGLRIVGDVGGDPSAPTILLLHGGGQTRHSWGKAMLNLVERGYHVINLDARGHGDSEWAADGDYTLSALAQDVACVIDTLSSKPALVGASMGGATSLYLAGTHDEPIASALVLVDIVPQINDVGASRIQAFMSASPDGFATLEEVADAVAAYNSHRPRPKDVSGLMKNLRRRENGRLYWHWDPKLVTSRENVEPPLRLQQLTAAADKVRIPTLLVRAENSDIVTDEGVEDLKRRVPGVEVFDVGGAGHMVAGDKNDAFNQGVFDFLTRRLPPRSLA
jgi:pimeloyl-ACP methyl ester carboxylesterase